MYEKLVRGMFRNFYLNFIILLSNIGVCLPQIVGYADDAPKPAFVPRVVNGRPAKLGDVPYQLAFKSKAGYNTYRTFCGGSIIGPDKVISAAHCFEEKKSSWLRSCGKGSASKKNLRKTFAVAGNLMNRGTYSRDSTENGQWRKLKSMYFPPRYNFPRNDISVGFTSMKFNFNSYVSAIPFATRYRDYVGKCLASGYGRISEVYESDRLLLADLDVYSTSTCSRIHWKDMHNFICTSDVVSDIHKGDSGGPLVCSGTGDPSETSKGLLVGVVSGNRVGAGSFFTRVSSFQDFITTSKCCCIRGNVIMVFMCLLYSDITILIFFYFKT